MTCRDPELTIEVPSPMGVAIGTALRTVRWAVFMAALIPTGLWFLVALLLGAVLGCLQAVITTLMVLAIAVVALVGAGPLALAGWLKP